MKCWTFYDNKWSISLLIILVFSGSLLSCFFRKRDKNRIIIGKEMKNPDKGLPEEVFLYDNKWSFFLLIILGFSGFLLSCSFQKRDKNKIMINQEMKNPDNGLPNEVFEHFMIICGVFLCLLSLFFYDFLLSCLMYVLKETKWPRKKCPRTIWLR